jgi:hypothetical protein
MHDDMQVIRQLQLEKCFQDGQFPCRWVPDLGYGYGYPLFNFYPPLPYFVGQVFRSLGFSFIVSVKLTSVVQFILANLFMFILANSLFGPVGGFMASLFYTYAPYHALNIYVRGAMNEAWAAVFFPLIFYFSRRLILKTNLSDFLGLSFAFTGLLLSHNPMVLTFTPFFLIWCLFNYAVRFTKFNLTQLRQNITTPLVLFLSGCLSLGLAAFFTLPVLLETKYVQIETMFSNYFDFSAHFTSLNQLFISNFWGDGASVWGQDDRMSFMVGYLHWLLPLFIILASLYLLFKTKLESNFRSLLYLTLILITFGFLAAFMTHQRSVFIWLLLKPLQKIQFPWRFLNHTSFFLSLSTGIIPLILSKFKKLSSPKVYYSFLSLLVITLLGLNLNYFHPVVSGPITDSQKLSGQAWVNQVTAGIYDYLPKGASKAPQSAAANLVDTISPPKAANIVSSKKGTDWLLFNTQVNQTAKFTLAQFYFPNFKLFDNFQPLAFAVEPELGRISFSLEPGDHQIYLKLYNTPIRRLANLLSLGSWLLAASLLLSPVWIKRLSKK